MNTEDSLIGSCEFVMVFWFFVGPLFDWFLVCGHIELSALCYFIGAGTVDESVKTCTHGLFSA